MTKTSFSHFAALFSSCWLLQRAFSALQASQQQANDSEGAIEQMMSPEEFKAAGLDKLSARNSRTSTRGCAGTGRKS